MKKGILISALVLAMVLSMLQGLTLTSSAATWTGTGGGSGTSADPWLLSTPADLVALQTFTNTGNTKGSMYFKLANDIDLTGISWIPMGLNSGDPGFNAHLDGNNKKISNVSIGTSAAYYKGRYGGFFGVISSGSVSNLGIENITIFGDDTGQPDGRYGGMVGWLLGSQASNCYVKNVSLTMSSNSRTYGGGFAGWMALDWTGASISNCCVIGTNFISSAVAAGFCAIAIQNGGGAQYATISNCFAVGFTDIKNVSTFSWGKAGFLKRWDSPAHTSQCYYNYSGTSKLDTDGSTDVNCVSKTLTEFSDGTVTNLLNNGGSAWVQKNGLPTLAGFVKPDYAISNLTQGATTVSVTATKNVTGAAIIIIAAYNGSGELVAVHSEDITNLSGDGIYNLDVTGKTFSSAKAFIWNGLASTKPLI